MLNAVFLALWGAFSLAAPAQSPAEADLVKRLSDGPRSIKDLDGLLAKAEEHSALALYLGAGFAHQEHRLEDSAFLLNAARLRAGFDQACFPPKGTGGGSPLVAYGALQMQFSRAITPEVLARPEVYARVVGRIKAFHPKAPADYQPGYEFTARKPEAEAWTAVKAAHEAYLDYMMTLSGLLNRPEYFAAFRTVQDFNLKTGEARPSVAAKDQALEIIARIEKAQGVQILAAR